jgi:DNA polymerase I-like protein with 3'-5' exonuclease and polymerase domains
MVELHPLIARYNSYIILMIHDALVVESDRRYRKEVMALIKSVMEKPRFEGYPSIRIDMKVGDNLGTTK